MAQGRGLMRRLITAPPGDAYPGAFMTDSLGVITWHERGLKSSDAGAQAHAVILGAQAGAAVEERWRAGVLTGRAFELGGSEGGGGWRLAMHPFRDRDGVLLGWSGATTPLTEPATFISELSRRLRWESDPLAILERTLEALGQHFGVSRVNYSEIDHPAGLIIVDRDWTNGVPSVAGTWPIESIGSEILAEHASGRPFATDDLFSDPRFDAYDRAPYAAAQNVAILTVPLVKQGRLEALLSIQQDRPRHWTEAEIRLAEEVAERTWSALQRARAQTAQRESEALLSAIMTHAPIGIYLKDHEGRYVAANREMGELFGRPVDEVLGRTAGELLNPELASTIEAIDAEVLRQGKMIAVEEYLEGAGRYEWSLVMRFPVQLAPGAPSQVGGFDIDITPQKQVELELERSRQALFQSEKLTALGSLLAGVSHELNNPLSVVIGQAQMLEERVEGSPLAERAAKIRLAAERCSRIVQTFLAMARQQRPQASACDLNGLVETALDLTEFGLIQAGVVVERDLCADAPQAYADPDQIQQVLVNLIVNAKQALSDWDGPRRLTVRTYHEENLVKLLVADTGPGVPDALRHRIFDPFFTTKPKGAGTGVGLSFSQGVVEAHGGQLVLLETDDGAAFELSLPCAPNEGNEV